MKSKCQCVEIFVHSHCKPSLLVKKLSQRKMYVDYVDPHIYSEIKINGIILNS